MTEEETGGARGPSDLSGCDERVTEMSVLLYMQTSISGIFLSNYGKSDDIQQVLLVRGNLSHHY